MTLRTTGATVSALFSASSLEFLAFNARLEWALLPGKLSDPTEREQMTTQLANIHHRVITALYKDMGLPAPALGEWLQEHAWQPLWARVWYHPRQYWHESCWPTLQHWWS